ncbi:MAG TPA: class I SAM-dependent methyltransferase [Noviherbaspirillum sp.]|uniref:class I SAM-dependent methyltransferase n=1 Tax=Noviherbaspirillum sp. TaxID=1926288 RepID=UPI002B45EC96|nr:class I SAM-dependent methyltransferase [Noviherbaspirillum sp.]HJV84203.1 class I SAM-dependent methyltransferase [Noviherbaspirillum sp.]
MKQSARFWDRVAERYAKMPVRDEAAYQKKLQLTREYFRPDMEVLEIGCGTGSTAIAHAPYVKHIHAIDISSKMIDIAQGKAKAGNIGNVTFKHASIEELGAPAQSLDAVLALNLLHLLDDRDETIARIHTMLKPGGVFVSSTVCLRDMAMLFRIVAPVAGFFGLLPLIKVLSARELEDSLTRAGFAIDRQWRPGKNKAVFIVARKAGMRD